MVVLRWKRGWTLRCCTCRFSERGVEDGLDDFMPLDAYFGETSQRFEIRLRLFAWGVGTFGRFIVILEVGEGLKDEKQELVGKVLKRHVVVRCGFRLDS